MPLPERYEIPEATVRAIAEARREGGRIVAVGTSVVRALEDSARHDVTPRAGAFLATLTLDQGYKPRVVDGLLTGIHVPGESHYRLLSAFAKRDILTRASAFACEAGYRPHEFGDAALLLPGLLAAARRAA
jgi:S-adenosylmethionine:tRNA ribosyltransferase-isomerase